MACWNRQDYDNWINDMKPINHNVIELNLEIETFLYVCSEEGLKSLEGLERLPNLKSLNCTDHELEHFDGINKLKHLEKLNIGGNLFQSLDGICSLVNLRNLNCFNNYRLKSLTGIECLTKLVKLNVSHMELTSLVGIEHLTELVELDCTYNKLASFEQINKLTQLEILNCSENCFESLEGIELMQHLRELCCDAIHENQLITITRIKEIIKKKYCYQRQQPWITVIFTVKN